MDYNINSYKLMIISVKNNNLELFDFLYKNCKDYNKDATFNAIMHIACYNGNYSIIQHLLNNDEIKQYISNDNYSIIFNKFS